MKRRRSRRREDNAEAQAAAAEFGAAALATVAGLVLGEQGAPEETQDNPPEPPAPPGLLPVRGVRRSGRTS